MNDLPKTRREMLKRYYKPKGLRKCTSCGEQYEAWVTTNGKFMPFNLPRVAGDSDEQVIVHYETCTGKKAPETQSRKPEPSARQRGEDIDRSVQQLRDRGDALVVLAIYDNDDAHAAYRLGLDPEDLRHQLITQANNLKRHMEAERASR